MAHKAGRLGRRSCSQGELGLEIEAGQEPGTKLESSVEIRQGRGQTGVRRSLTGDSCRRLEERWWLPKANDGQAHGQGRISRKRSSRSRIMKDQDQDQEGPSFQSPSPTITY